MVRRLVMYKYEKRLQYPIDIKRKDLKMAKFIIAQYGGPHGEMGASTRYLAQRYTMPDERGRTLLTEIGTEEIGHEEMICTIVYQLTKGASLKELEDAGLAPYYVDHGVGAGVPEYLLRQSHPGSDVQGQMLVLAG